MGSIVTRKTSKGELRYQAHVRRKGHPARTKTFNSRTRAARWITRVEAAVIEGRDLPHRDALKRTVAEMVEVYVDEEDIRRLTSKEQLRRAHDLRRWAELLGPITVAELKTPAIKQARRRLKATGDKGRPITSATVNRYLASLSRFCTFLVAEGLLPENPVRAALLPRGREKRRDRVLTREEREALLEACSEDRRLHALLVLALTTGGRQGELLGLHWSEVDLQRARVRFLRTKSGEPRSVPLPSAAVGALRELGKVRHVSGLVFGSDSFPLQAWRRARKAAGLEDLRFHDLRHCYATALAEAGATLSELKQALGHKTLAMVLRYQHLTESATENALRQRLAGMDLV